MVIAAAQYNIQWQEPDANEQKILQLLENCRDDIDLLLLPEMWDHGFIMQPTAIEDFNHHRSIDLMQHISREKSIIVGGSIPLKDKDKYYNSMVYVDGNAILYRYDKAQLFTPAGEKENYSAGNATSDASISGHKIRSLICYDLRFPYLSFNNTGYDALVYVANWPITRIDQWQSLLIARAIENQAYTIGVNRIGIDQNGYQYNGSSIIVDYRGRVICHGGEGEGILTAVLDFPAQQKYRTMLPFLSDIRNDVV